MRKKTSLLLFLLIISNDIVFGKHKNKTKIHKPVQRELNDLKNKAISRLKRSINEGSDVLFSSDLHAKGVSNGVSNHVRSLNKRNTFSDNNMEDDPPFWGNRGRRESLENSENQLPSNSKFRAYKLISRLDLKQTPEEDSPFWGNRGRRDSGESGENDLNPNNVRWKNSDSNQEDEPFWGTRGRRESYPFWGNRGRRQNLLLRSDDNSPFWGNRGRREESEPFWGNRGRREFTEQFLGSRGNTEQKNNYFDEMEPFWGNRGRRKPGVESSFETTYNLQDNLDSETQKRVLSFWGNRGRDSKIKYLFNAPARLKMQYTPSRVIDGQNYEPPLLPFQQNTVGDHRIYAEQPHYIVLERSSRSSGEIDPFIISRGKKYGEFDLTQAARDRRGAIEELVKSVRNDPYYIARGKKDFKIDKVSNVTSLQDDILKTKQLLCATVNMILAKHQDSKQKRETTNINERDRRTILKKLALQLQMDPYFVSRGKKDTKAEINESLENNLNQLLEICT